MKKKLGALLLVIVLLVSLAACSNKTALPEDVAFTTYKHPDIGFTLPVPNNWEKVYENQDAAYWTNADGTMALMVLCQLGGNSYYNEEEVGDLLADMFAKGFSSWQELSREKAEGYPMGWRIVGQGVDQDGNTVITDGMITAPLDAVRFYLFAMAGPGEYQENLPAIDAIYTSFDVVTSQDKLYTQMMEEKEARYTEQAEAEENQQTAE